MGTPRAHLLSKVAKDFVERLVADDGSTEPQIELSIPVNVPDAVTGDVDVVLASRFEVTDVVVEKRGAATGVFANTIQVKNGAAVISDAIDMNGAADGAVKRALTLDDASSTIAAGGTLRITRTKAGGNAQCRVVVRGYIRA